jgi:hypothetical protein
MQLGGSKMRSIDSNWSSALHGSTVLAGAIFDGRPPPRRVNNSNAFASAISVSNTSTPLKLAGLPLLKRNFCPTGKKLTHDRLIIEGSTKTSALPMSACTKCANEGTTSIIKEEEMQNTLTLVLTIKSPADYEALTTLLPLVKGQMDNAFHTINTVHFARVVFLDNNTKVAVITEFDGDFSTYVQDFAEALGPVFDALFEHTVEAPPVPVEDTQNTQAFIDFSQKYNLPVAYFYSSYPDLTVLNILDLEKNKQG